MKTVLMTGAGGSVATMLRPMLRARYDNVVLSDLTEPKDLQANETFRPAQLADLDQACAAAEGVDGIVHLGGFSVEGDWETIHQANIVGCYNMFEAARRAGCKRFIFASSNHAIGFYRRREKIDDNDRVRPDTRYGVSKAFGEALGSLYADKYGLGVMSIRIGNVAMKPADKRRLSIWLHPEDLMQLIAIGLEHPDMRNEIVFGNSASERDWWDNSSAYRLGYKPRHNAEDHVEHALAEQSKLAADPIGDQFHGGGFCTNEFNGDLDRI